MADPMIRKVPAGCEVDGLDLLQTNCGCDDLTGTGGYGATVKIDPERVGLRKYCNGHGFWEG